MTATQPDEAAGPPVPTKGPWRAHARLTYALRWPIIGFWLAITVLALMFPPPVSGDSGNSESFLAVDVETEVREMEIFGFPLFSRTVAVQRDPNGLSAEVQTESVLDALAVNQRENPAPLLGALPMPNAVTFGAGQDERGTTVLTYLFMDPRAGFGTQHTQARAYAQEYLERPEDHYIGVTGSVPARAQQAYLVGLALPRLEMFTLVAIVLLVAIAFRSVVVPFVALGASAIALLVTMWLVTLLADVLGVTAPAELQPVLLALLLGVVTDYTIFYVTGLGTAFGRRGHGKRDAVNSAVSTYTPIVVAAGVTVAAATLSLVVARSPFYRAFGPAMAVTILVGLVVAVTLVPAVIAVLGRGVFWPRRPAGVASMAEPSRGMARLVSLLSRKGPAAGALVVSAVILTLMALPIVGMLLKAGFTSSLPAENNVKQAAVAAAEGFSPGITSPTSILIEGPGVADDLDGLIELQDRVAEHPGVAGVVGPALSMPQLGFRMFTSPEHDAARMLVVLKDSPLDGTAIQTLSQLRENIPLFASEAGLDVAKVGVGGDTALAADIIDGTLDDLGRLALAGLAVNLLILIIFLRSVAAPVYLLACNVLSVAAALGLMTWVFTDLLGEDGITFYVPFASAVLLVALGSDYNIFGVGRTWEEARHRSLPDAMAIAMPETSKAITTAGVVLAASFAMLMVIPLSAFRELGFVMAVGILLDVFVVRMFMVPALLTLVGQKSAWPRKSLRVAQA